MSFIKNILIVMALGTATTLAAPASQTLTTWSIPSSNRLSERDDASWSIQVEIGSQTFDIGDQDASKFSERYMEPVCSPRGCDEGNSQTFGTVIESYGSTDDSSATISMEGNFANDNDVYQRMLTVVRTAMLQSASCKSVKATKCLTSPMPLNAKPMKKRETGQTVENCQLMQFGDCKLTNFVQATMYDDHENQKAQLTFRGSSPDTDLFDCEDLIGGINTVLGGLELGPVGDLAGSAACAFCKGITGGSC